MKEFCFPRQATGDVYLPGNQVSTKEAKKRKYEEGVVRDLGRTFATSQPDAEEDKPMPEEWTPIGAPDGTLLFYYNFNTHEKRLPRKREAHAHTRVQLGGVEKDQAKLEADALAAAGASSTSTPVGKSAAAVAPSPIAGPSPPAVEPGVLEAANANGAAQPGRELSMDELRKKQAANSIVTLGADGAAQIHGAKLWGVLREMVRAGQDSTWIGDWQKLTVPTHSADGNGGVPYFYNATTGVSQWEAPENMPAQAV